MGSQLPLDLEYEDDLRTKVCIDCAVDKRFSAYGRTADRHDGHEARCKACVSIRAEFVRQVKLHAPPKPEICDRDGCTRKATDCDHDPAIKDPQYSFRGWLCKPCNGSIGQLGDSIEGVENTLMYLKRAKDRG